MMAAAIGICASDAGGGQLRNGDNDDQKPSRVPDGVGDKNAHYVSPCHDDLAFADVAGVVPVLTLIELLVAKKNTTRI